MLRTPRIFLAVAPLMTFGCSAQAPDEGGELEPDAGRVVPAPAPEITIDDIPASTEYMSVPVIGTGPANGTIIAETATESEAGNIGGDGRFCIDVPLQQGIVNTIWFRAQNPDGAFSDEIEKTVSQEGAPPDGSNQTGDDDASSNMRNIARFGDIWMDHKLHSGAPENMNDGDPTTVAHIENRINVADETITIRLIETAPLHHVRVRSDADCPLRKYYLLITDEPDPGPAPGNDWTEVLEVNDGAGDDVLEPGFQVEPTVTHISLLTRNGCSGTWSPEDFKVQEIEAFTRDEPPPTTGPDGPTCSSGSPL